MSLLLKNTLKSLINLLRNTNYNEKRKEYFCSRCGKKLWDYAKTGLCGECYRKLEQDNSKIPTKEILLNDFNQLKSMSAIGRKYNVSQKTIKKWLLKYNIVK